MFSWYFYIVSIPQHFNVHKCKLVYKCVHIMIMNVIWQDVMTSWHVTRWHMCMTVWHRHNDMTWWHTIDRSDEVEGGRGDRDGIEVGMG